MTAGHTLRRKADVPRRQKKMNPQAQKASSSRPVTCGSTDSLPYHQFHDPTAAAQTAESEATGIHPPDPAAYRQYPVQNVSANEDERATKLRQHAQNQTPPFVEDVTILSKFASRMRLDENIPIQLVELIRNMITDLEGEQHAEDFLYAAEYPPITRMSLSELDIQNIIQNIKLRHDVNFDRDLSFRPNLDGSKGREKIKAAEKYWSALTAELYLYARLFQGAPSLSNMEDARWLAVVAGSKRRIPRMFQSIQDILKNLVPDRDQRRVDEHMDDVMLMQQIERGVCDLVKLSEWLAHLLKEHCAPMRDAWVDKMVEWTKKGVADSRPELIVKGLRELLGILEAMKLDVANHQIRNLRALLIEDTIHFQRNYHLVRIANGRINVEAAQHWYACETLRIRQTVPESVLSKNPLLAQMEIFVHAMVSLTFSCDPREDFPETFYLDLERLRMLKSELHDLVYVEMCFEAFDWLCHRLGCKALISHAAKQALRNSLAAITGEGPPHKWAVNQEYISLEIVRHASQLCGYEHTYHADMLQETSEVLRTLFSSFPSYVVVVERAVLPQVLQCVNQHLHSSPIDLFNTLTPSATPPPPPPASLVHQPNGSLSISSVIPEQITDLVQRITHIALLHFRIWGPIVYVLPEEKESAQPIPHLIKPPTQLPDNLQPVIPESPSAINTSATDSSQSSTDSNSTSQTAHLSSQASEAPAME